ncbi:hypothetical protein HHK36_015563 [Tetracentron sinense]|uniref:Uncharacterized protein n=1 Tax=Tetracentron sinense TaxID=13715 RepID=A0A835DCY2_TETSI|nr:hypothetical protein HHK36_015563 [Tetracentron sinense]
MTKPVLTVIISLSGVAVLREGLTRSRTSSETRLYLDVAMTHMHACKCDVTANKAQDDDLEYNEEGEAEERTREASDWALSRAVRDDESRRNAPLAPENAVKIMETMRGVSLGGFVSDWADRLPEDRWED